MKYSTLFITGLLILGSCKTSTVKVKKSEEVTTTFYFTRHAEKDKDGTRDPNLSATGKQRAANLATQLKDKNIKAIYSTNYKRTKQTAQPLADALGLEVKIYDPNKLKALKIMLLEKHKKGSVLIVGHSNTTPTLVNTFMETDKYAPLNDTDEFDKIFTVQIRKDGFKTSEMITGLTNPTNPK
jgi:broad specificity phosphatase PhoE